MLSFVAATRPLRSSFLMANDKRLFCSRFLHANILASLRRVNPNYSLSRMVACGHQSQDFGYKNNRMCLRDFVVREPTPRLVLCRQCHALIYSAWSTAGCTPKTQRSGWQDHNTRASVNCYQESSSEDFISYFRGFRLCVSVKGSKKCRLHKFLVLRQNSRLPMMRDSCSCIWSWEHVIEEGGVCPIYTDPQFILPV